MNIRLYKESDLFQVSEIHQESFPRQGFSKEWIRSLFGAFPRSRIYVADIDERISGYIVWTEKIGFRTAAVLELEQIAVGEKCRGQGIGRTLIKQSLELVKACLDERGSILKAVMVSTRMDNGAQRLYKKILGVETVAVISGLFSGDEILMMAELMK